MPIRNVDRSVGAMLSNRISKRYGEAGLPEDTIKVTFRGNAGRASAPSVQRASPSGSKVTRMIIWARALRARLIVVPPAGSTFIADENIIIGITVLYGATSGEAYVKWCRV
jgi:glutamate synthase domain-containing protein 3